MFGYMESDYTVERSFALDCEGQQQHMEIRVRRIDPKWAATLEAYGQPGAPSLKKEGAATRYIALYAKDQAGKKGFDFLLLYNAGNESQLEQDWARITTDPTVNIKDLQWDQYVVWHATGYLRGGGVVMY